MKLPTLAAIIFLSLTPTLLHAAAPSLSLGSDGKLLYTTDDMGNRIPDYSYAGYKGGGVTLPTLPNKIILSPLAAGADNTAQIQAALNAVSALTPDAHGFRGAVFLNPGTYTCAGSLTFSTGGVVLRGAGPATILFATGTARTFITAAGPASTSTSGTTVSITDTYVPCGATSFNVTSASTFAVGNTVLVQRPQTASWILAIHMDDAPTHMGTEAWVASSGIKFERTITAITGTQITIDFPLTNPIESQYCTGTMVHYTDNRTQSMGIENLTLSALFSDVPPQTSPGNVLNSTAVSMDNCENSWMKNIHLSGYANGLSFGGGSKWCTITDCDYQNASTDSTTSAEPSAFSFAGRQCFLDRCTGSNAFRYHMVVTQSACAGPNAFLDCTCVTANWLDAGPHQRWASGMLFDRIKFTRTAGSNKCELDLANRLLGGSGQGWAMGFSTAYNCQTVGISVEEPSYAPYQYNWCIGGIATKITGISEGPPGEFQNFGTLVNPSSLYLQQLQERLGSSALQNIGYPRFTDNYRITNKSTNEAILVQAASTANGAAVTELPYTSIANAKWQFIDIGSGRYEIKNLNSGKALATSGSAIIQTTYTGNSTDQWTLTDLPGGATTLTNKASGQKLTVPLGLPPDNVQLIQAPANSQTNQQFTIISAP